MSTFWTITTPLLLLLDGYLIGVAVERCRARRRHAEELAEVSAMLGDLLERTRRPVTKDAA